MPRGGRGNNVSIGNDGHFNDVRNSVLSVEWTLQIASGKDQKLIWYRKVLITAVTV